MMKDARFPWLFSVLQAFLRVGSQETARDVTAEGTATEGLASEALST